MVIEHDVGPAPRLVHQREVAFVQEAHRRHQADAPAFAATGCAPSP